MRNGYELWKQNYAHMKIPPEQDAFRFKIFEKNVEEMSIHNAKEGETYKMGINQFTGLSK